MPALYASNGSTFIIIKSRNNDVSKEVMKLADDKKNSDHNLLTSIHERIEKIAAHLEKSEIREYIQLMNRPWKIISTNIVAGIARGVGIAIGFTIFASTIVYFLQLLGKLDLPIIGKYIAEIVKVVQVQLEGRVF